jgi:hypothetical protein
MGAASSLDSIRASFAASIPPRRIDLERIVLRGTSPSLLGAHRAEMPRIQKGVPK